MRAERLDLDFASLAPRGPRIGLALLAAGSAALLAGGVVWGEAWSAQAAQAGTLAALENLAPARPASARASAPSAADEAARRAALRVARGLQAPWSDLLGALEAAPHADVALLAIEPSFAKQSLRLTAEARDADAMLDYVAALQGDQRLKRVALASHLVEVQTPGRPIRFTVQAEWQAAP